MRVARFCRRAVPAGMSALLVALLASCALFRHQNPDVAALPLLNDAEKQRLSDWLDDHPELRVPSEAECGCDDHIQRLRKAGVWSKGIPDYHPYVTVADLNGDGIEDFAVMLADRGASAEPGVLVIFNGPSDKSGGEPALVHRRLPLTRYALFLTTQGHRLLVGPFESEGCILEPKGATYAENCRES